MAKINIVFDPGIKDPVNGPDELVFVEVETIEGASINAGDWSDGEHSTRVLTIDLEVLNAKLTPTPNLLHLYLPNAGEIWEHHSGRLYRVDGILNTAHPSDKFPVMVAYTQVDAGTQWTRPLTDWHRSFGNLPKVYASELVPYFSHTEASINNDGLIPIRKRPVTTVQANGLHSISMGFIVALVEDEATAKIMVATLNEAFPPHPNEPKE